MIEHIQSIIFECDLMCVSVVDLALILATIFIYLFLCWELCICVKGFLLEFFSYFCIYFSIFFCLLFVIYRCYEMFDFDSSI